MMNLLPVALTLDPNMTAIAAPGLMPGMALEAAPRVDHSSADRGWAAFCGVDHEDATGAFLSMETENPSFGTIVLSRHDDMFEVTLAGLGEFETETEELGAYATIPEAFQAAMRYIAANPDGWSLDCRF